MTGLEFWALVAPVVAHIRDGHLFTYWPTNMPVNQLPLFPLTVRVFDNRIFVYRDFSNQDHRLEGAEILSINGFPARHILKRMSSVLTGEGGSRTAVPYRIGNLDFFKWNLYGLLRIESPFNVVYRDARGKRRREIAGRTFPEFLEAWAARNPEPKMMADIKFLDDGKIAVLTIRSFEQYVDPDRKLTIHHFLQQSFEQIHERKSSNLIIDVRDNSGGMDAPGAQLFSYLWTAPSNTTKIRP